MRTAIKWGVILAATLTIWTLVVHVLGIYTTRIRYADVVDRVVAVVPLAVTTLALLDERRRRGGSLGWGRGVLVGLGLAVVSAPLTVAAMWWYHHVVNPEWLSILVAYKQQSLAASGMPADQVAAQVQQLQQGGTDRSQIAGGLVGSVVFGLAVSLVVSTGVALAGRAQRSR